MVAGRYDAPYILGEWEVRRSDRLGRIPGDSVGVAVDFTAWNTGADGHDRSETGSPLAGASYDEDS